LTCRNAGPHASCKENTEGPRATMRGMRRKARIMETIIGGVSTSHTTTIACAKDAKKFDNPVRKPIFEGYEPVQEWFRQKQPDVLVYIYNDHMTAFFDHFSHFALGVGEEFGPADEGGGPRDVPAIKGDPDFAAHVARVMVANEF